ncbi:MAG TPA: MAPEG family protein, partial [Candidatus Binatus sp.]|nr:MAPEG family protein [Candidatus Binatus sp.]
MKTEITLLVQVTALTGILWVPYVLNRAVVRGIGGTVGYPHAPKALAPWAERLRAAHAKAVENLVVFAALVLAAQ